MRIKQQNHTKVKHIGYLNLNSSHQYITSKKFNNEEVSLLFNLRCKSVNSFKDNFQNMCGLILNVTTESPAMQCIEKSY